MMSFEERAVNLNQTSSLEFPAHDAPEELFPNEEDCQVLTPNSLGFTLIAPEQFSLLTCAGICNPIKKTKTRLNERNDMVR